MKPFDKEHNQKTLRALHETGMELGKDELEGIRKSAFANIRKAMRGKGYEWVEKLTDEQLFHLMREAMVWREDI